MAVTAPDVEFSQLDMPALSSAMKEGKVVSWLKAQGAAVGIITSLPLDLSHMMTHPSAE